MENKSHIVSNADFNKLIQVHRPNIIAYAMMLWAGSLDRDPVILKTMGVLWERRKEYRPSEWSHFCQWSYTQIEDQIVSQDSCAEVSRFARCAGEAAARFLPDTHRRMNAFDKAFFELSGKDKEILSISCQHHQLRDKYITNKKGLSRDQFNTKVEKLQLALLITTGWNEPKISSAGITPAANLALLKFAVNAAGEEGRDSMMDQLLQDEEMLEQYFRHISLQQALMIRLIDEPYSQLRDAVAEKPQWRRRVYAFALILFLLPLLLITTASENGLKNDVKALAHSVIPEPSSVSMLAVGLGALLMRRSREDRHKVSDSTTEE
jgi:hypothetical protein